MKVAALDLGSNSFLCLIADVSAGKVTHVYYDGVKIVRLGEGLATSKAFKAEALMRAESCLKEFSKTIQKEKPQKILAMATAAARDANNSDELFKIGKKYDIPIQIIPGEKEAEITFFGSVEGHANSNEDLIVIDVGGGSTEFILGNKKGINYSKSVNIGAVKITEMFFKNIMANPSEINHAKAYIQKEISEVAGVLREAKTKKIIAVAGTPTSLVSSVIGGFDAKRIDGYLLSKPDLESWINKLAPLRSEERESQFGFERGRSDVILGGTLILSTALECLSGDGLLVSTKGVRYGVAIEMEK